ncbi:hypothetical protein [Prevotella sp. HUN102]|uniref:hypothetical protein n=1 Tax=Prevotella sp. HUN102 TaxID=1392486 RepID=UPI00048B6394|nr:hypothetical protein [Prevotella sp. HUN102]
MRIGKKTRWAKWESLLILSLFGIVGVVVSCRRNTEKNTPKSNEYDTPDDVYTNEEEEKATYLIKDDPVSRVKATSQYSIPADDLEDYEEMASRLTVIKYNSYVNSEYGYELSYPDFLTPEPESSDGKSRRFVYKDITLNVSGHFNTMNWDVKTAMKVLSENASEEYIKDNYYIVSGTRGKKRYHVKAILMEDTWYTIRLEYPPKYETVITPLVNVVKNFQAPPPIKFG